MVIFLLWIGLICCSVANGLIYDYVETPQSYYYMVIPSIIDVILLVVHRVYTRNWYDPIDEIDSHHVAIFQGSFVISFIAMIFLLIAIHSGEISWGFFVGCVTMFLSFLIAAVKERDYADF